MTPTEEFLSIVDKLNKTVSRDPLDWALAEPGSRFPFYVYDRHRRLWDHPGFYGRFRDDPPFLPTSASDLASLKRLVVALGTLGRMIGSVNHVLPTTDTDGVVDRRTGDYLPTGIKLVDLRTGEVRERTREDYCHYRSGTPDFPGTQVPEPSQATCSFFRGIWPDEAQYSEMQTLFGSLLYGCRRVPAEVVATGFAKMGCDFPILEAVVKHLPWQARTWALIGGPSTGKSTVVSALYMVMGPFIESGPSRRWTAHTRLVVIDDLRAAEYADVGRYPRLVATCRDRPFLGVPEDPSVSFHSFGTQIPVPTGRPAIPSTREYAAWFIQGARRHYAES